MRVAEILRNFWAAFSELNAKTLSPFGFLYSVLFIIFIAFI